jgi:hypothetical protein
LNYCKHRKRCSVDCANWRRQDAGWILADPRRFGRGASGVAAAVPEHIQYLALKALTIDVERNLNARVSLHAAAASGADVLLRTDRDASCRPSALMPASSTFTAHHSNRFLASPDLLITARRETDLFDIASSVFA